MERRTFKDRLFADFALIGKAVASPHRLELLDLLSQGERSVMDLAREWAGYPIDHGPSATADGTRGR